MKWCSSPIDCAVVADDVLGERVGELVPVLGVERAQVPVLDLLDVVDVTHGRHCSTSAPPHRAGLAPVVVVAVVAVPVAVVIVVAGVPVEVESPLRAPEIAGAPVVAGDVLTPMGAPKSRW